MGTRELHVLNLIWFGHITRLFQWEKGGIFLVLMISTCLPTRRGRGKGVGTLWFSPTPGHPPPLTLSRVVKSFFYEH
jgi:hypothetical protein